MPNRILREGILTSDRVNQLGAHAELFYRRLMSIVDDFGRYSADVRLLRACCYPLRLNEVREADITRFLAEVQGAGLIALYAVDGKQYLELQDFRQQVRSTRSKWPARPNDEQLHGDAPPMRSTCAADAQHVHTSDGDEDEDGVGDDKPPVAPHGGGGEPGSESARNDAAPAASNPPAQAEQIPSPRVPRARTVAQCPPTEEEWLAYGATLSPPYPRTDALSAFNHYVAVGWMAGRNPAKDWRALVRTCHGRWLNRGGSSFGHNGQAPRRQATTLIGGDGGW